MANYTKRDIYTALHAIVGALPEQVTTANCTYKDFPAAIKAFTENEIAILDRRNSARAKHTSPKDLAKQAADNALIAAILDKYAPDTEIYASMVGKDFGISTPKASALLRKAPKMFVEVDRRRVEKGKTKVAIYKVTALDSEDEGQVEDLDTEGEGQVEDLDTPEA